MRHLGAHAILLWIAWLPLFATLSGCGGQEATPKALEEARARWNKAAIRNYDLEWESTGPSQSHYFVSVRNDQVQKVEGLGREGERIALKPADTRFYSVDGLFTVVAEELAILDTESPFGQPKGTKAVLRFTTDPTLGYLKTYRRDVMGMARGLAIDVIRFRPVEPGSDAGAGKK